jgi:predicted MFS family arabinose efflux permease
MHPAHDEASGCTTPPRRAGWALLLILAAIQFTHVVDFLIMIPLGPRYLRELNISPQQFSLLVSAYAFSAAVSGLLAASFIDRFDRKRALLFLYGGFTGGTALCAVAPDFGILLLARGVAGAFGGILAAATLAIIGDTFPEHRRGLATGVVMSSFSVASIVGVPMGLFLAGLLGTWAPFGVLAILSSALLPFAARVMPPVRHHLDGGHEVPDSPWKLLLLPAHLKAYVLMVCLVLGTFTIIPYLPTFLVGNLGWTESELALMYLFGGIGTLLTMSVFGRLADRFGKLPVFRVLASLTMVPVLLITNLSPAPLGVVLLITTLFFVVASGRMVPAMALVTSSARPAYRGSFMSVIASVQQMSLGLASLVAGALVRQPVKDGPLEGYTLVGVLACIMSAAGVILGGQVRPAAEPEPVPLEGEVVVPGPLARPSQAALARAAGSGPVHKAS